MTRYSTHRTVSRPVLRKSWNSALRGSWFAYKLSDAYLHQFTHLHTATNRTHWSADTRYKAPNKPLLMLAVMDQFAQVSFASELVELTPELGEMFAGYWSSVMPPHRHGNIAMPFFHLRRDGFWHLIVRPDKEGALATLTTMTSVGQVRTVLLGARLDDELVALLRIDESREMLRRTLIETYFRAGTATSFAGAGTGQSGGVSLRRGTTGADAAPGVEGNPGSVPYGRA